jgi:hypothetical protein
MPEQETIVWRADPRYRFAATAVIVVLLLLSVRVLVSWGYLALIGVLLVLGVCVQTYWVLLRPRLTAGPDGVVVVAGRTPEQLAWKDIRRAQPGRTGFTIATTDGREVVSRFPVKHAPSDKDTEADAVAAYLVARAAWERKPTGDAPTYHYEPPAKKPAAKKR